MEKENELKNLFKEIFGSKIDSMNFKNMSENKNVIKGVLSDKCKITECKSCKNRQDRPYYKDINSIENLIIAESPGSGIEQGDLGFVFGWHEFETMEKSASSNHYGNYFFNILNLDRATTYITDAIKCYTPKELFNNSFSFCEDYLLKEIKIINPKRIIIISKHGVLQKFIKDNFKSIEIICIPHPSLQNINKIPTVGNIFKKIGEINKNRKWVALGDEILKEYGVLTQNKIQ